MERVEFGWYAKKASIPTLAGFAAGIGTYLALHAIPQIPSVASALGL